jgi:hypothetical protein
MMRIVFGALAIVALAAGAASAKPGHLNDAEYLQAARCAGLASSKNLGSTDSGAMKAWLEAQSTGRMSYTLDRADQVQDDARREADHAGDVAKPRLQAELSGVCTTLRG